MEDLLGQLKGHTDTVRMTVDEKSAMRSRLSEYMSLRPVRSDVAARQQTVQTKRFVITPKLMPFMAAFLSLLLAGGGVSYAAETSVPGDTLYPVKVHVNEELRAALIIDDEAKAEWETTRAERRLGEARVMIETKIATPEQFDALETRFAAHEERIEATIAMIEEKKGPEVAARISSQLEASLSAHKAILEKLSAGEEVDVKAEIDAAFVAEAKMSSSARIVAKVEKAKEKAKEVRQRTEKSVTDESAAKRAGELADTKLRVALSIATKLETRLDGEEEGMGARVLLSLDESIVAAEVLIATGDAAMEAGKFNDAFRAYNEAIRELRGAEIFAQGDFAAEKKVEVVVEKKEEVKAETVVPKIVEKVIPPKIIWKDDGDQGFTDDTARSNAEGKRAYAQEEITKLRARIAAFAADGYTWTDGKASLADAEGHRVEAEARFSAGRYDTAYESFKEAYHIAVGANGQYVYVLKELEQGGIDTEARARAEMKRGYATDAIAKYEETIAYKTDALGEMHEFVAELRVNLAAGKESIAEGDVHFAAGDYDEAYQSYLSVWSELQY